MGLDEIKNARTELNLRVQIVSRPPTFLTKGSLFELALVRLPCGLRSGSVMALGFSRGALRDLDQVAARVVEHCRGDRPHIGRFLCESDTQAAHSRELLFNVVHCE